MGSTALQQAGPRGRKNEYCALEVLYRAMLPHEIIEVIFGYYPPLAAGLNRAWQEWFREFITQLPPARCCPWVWSVLVPSNRFDTYIAGVRAALEAPAVKFAMYIGREYVMRYDHISSIYDYEIYSYQTVVTIRADFMTVMQIRSDRKPGGITYITDGLYVNRVNNDRYRVAVDGESVAVFSDTVTCRGLWRFIVADHVTKNSYGWLADDVRNKTWKMCDTRLMYDFWHGDTEIDSAVVGAEREAYIMREFPGRGPELIAAIRYVDELWGWQDAISELPAHVD